jgi:hypothetical protein
VSSAGWAQRTQGESDTTNAGAGRGRWSAASRRGVTVEVTPLLRELDSPSSSAGEIGCLLDEKSPRIPERFSSVYFR